MTYIAHNLLEKTVSRLDNKTSMWPFDDHTEAQILAVWLTPYQSKQVLCFAICTPEGRIGQVVATDVRLGSYVAIPKHQIFCPKCSVDLGPTFSDQPLPGIVCTKGCGTFDWTPPKAVSAVS